MNQIHKRFSSPLRYVCQHPATESPSSVMVNNKTQFQTSLLMPEESHLGQAQRKHSRKHRENTEKVQGKSHEKAQRKHRESTCQWVHIQNEKHTNVQHTSVTETHKHRGIFISETQCWFFLNINNWNISISGIHHIRNTFNQRYIYFRNILIFKQ